MTYTTDELKTAFQKADAAGDTQAASNIAAEIRKRQSDPVVASLADATRVPEPQGFMEESGINALGRGVRENIGGGIGATGLGAAGAKGGAYLGTMLGGPGIGTAIGTGIGGIGGGILGALFGNEAQQAMFPTDESTQRIMAQDATQHPAMSAVGQYAPYLMGQSLSIPGLRTAFTKVTPAMTAAERGSIIGNRFGVGLGGTLGAAGEVAMPLVTGQEIDPQRALLGGIIGALFNQPNRLGKSLGMRATPTLNEVRATQAAAAIPQPPMPSSELAVQSPLIQTDVIPPGQKALPGPNVGVPVEDPFFGFRQPPMIDNAPVPLALPESAASGADTVMPAMRQEQAAAMQEQLTRLTERRAGMVSRGAGKPALAAVDKQIKARQNALKGLQNESTIIAPQAPEAIAPVVETGVALREQLATQETTPRTTARAEDFSNPNEFYRVIVGDDAFNDIISTGAVRTNASSKVEPGASITQRLKGRPTAFPSFSKGQVSLSYAGENPGHYVVVTSDPSMMPSSSGRHSKGKTMFPTNDAGEHMTHLSGKSVRVFKHMGDGQYDLVYDRGSVIGGRNKFPSSRPPSNAVALREQLSAQSEKVATIPEDLVRARANMAKGGDEAARVKANTEPVGASALRQQLATQETPKIELTPTRVAAKDAGMETKTRDTTKPEQMTPEESYEAYTTAKELAPNLADMPKTKKQIREGIAIAENSGIKDPELQKMFMDSAKSETGQFAGPYIKAQRIRLIEEAMEGKKPVSAEAVDTYGITLPEGYVQDGELYVYRPSGTVEAKSAPPAKPAPQAEQPAPQRDTSKPEQMTPEEFDEYVKQSGREYYLKHGKNAPMRTGQLNVLQDAIEKKLPVSAAAFDAQVEKGRPITLPEGYQRQGELYVYKPTNETTPVIPESSPPVRPANTLGQEPEGGQPQPVAAVRDSDTAVSAVADTPEVTALRKQLAKADEDIFNANEDGDADGVRYLERARRAIKANLEAALDTDTPKTLADKIRGKKVKPGPKGSTNLPLLGLSDAQMRAAWNGALELAARAVEAGATISKAARDAAAWVRSNFPTARFKDDDFHRAIQADIVRDTPDARKAGAREEARVAADTMDQNPDKFFSDADSTPVSTFMKGVDDTMRNAGRDVMSGRSARSVWQHIKDCNRNYLRGNQAALDDLAKGGGDSGRASPALDKLNTEINGTRPGASGVAQRGLFDDVVTRTKARTNELNEAYNGIRHIVDHLGDTEQDALLQNLVRWMQQPDYKKKLANQPEVLKAVETLRKVSRDMLKDLHDNGIDIGDAGEAYFSRELNVDTVRRNYDEFVNRFTKFYDDQWKQNDPGYVSDMVKARAAAKAYADSAILGHEGIALDGSDLNLASKKAADADFFKARTFTGAVSDAIDREASKFYNRNPFQTIAHQINRVERRIGLVKAFGKVAKDANGRMTLDPTARWRDFVDAAVKEGNDSIVPEVLQRYQTLFGIGANFDPKTRAFVQAVRNLGYYAYLPFSGINSMTEPTVLAMRLNKPVSGLFTAYGKTLRSMARQIKNMPLDYKERLADAMGLAENATMRAAMSLGKLDDQGLITNKNLAKYFFLTGNSMVSNATSNAAVDIGMSALRATLLDFKHDVNKNTARIWLEELGVKHADFDRVSKWLESHATDEDRFGKVLDSAPEAVIVKDALSKFAREARSLPDAGTKNKHSAGTFGSLLLSLQSYLYDFTDKVLGRNSRQFMQGMKGTANFDGNITSLSQAERVKLMAPMMLGMPSLIAANYGIALVRETLYPDPEKIRRDRERTKGEVNWNRFTRALTRSNMMGPYDMLFNMVTQARYQRDVAAAGLGPYLGGVLELAKNTIALGGDRNSDNTNTAERKAVRSAWNVGPRPLVNMALSSLPAVGKLVPAAAAGIQLASQRSVAEGAVDVIAGRQTSSGGGKKKPLAVP